MLGSGSPAARQSRNIRRSSPLLVNSGTGSSPEEQPLQERASGTARVAIEQCEAASGRSADRDRPPFLIARSTSPGRSAPQPDPAARGWRTCIEPARSPSARPVAIWRDGPSARSGASPPGSARNGDLDRASPNRQNTEVLGAAPTRDPRVRADRQRRRHAVTADVGRRVPGREDASVERNQVAAATGDVDHPPRETGPEQLTDRDDAVLIGGDRRDSAPALGEPSPSTLTASRMTVGSRG